jgi:serine/threonine-protein kinase HipA
MPDQIRREPQRQVTTADQATVVLAPVPYPVPSPRPLRPRRILPHGRSPTSFPQQRPSGSAGVQGAWPKLLLTQNKKGRWLPDPFVPDADATDHAIVKWVGNKHQETALILEAEAPYLELARAFGLRCARALTHRDGMLFIPRFDRRITNGQVERLGQESIVSAAGIAAFGHHADHEDYLAILKAACDDPAADVTEYVLRDVLNLAMGNPDNHGRNTVLQKDVDGTIRLTPLYDFCPMRLDRTVVARSTTWRCMRPSNPPTPYLLSAAQDRAATSPSSALGRPDLQPTGMQTLS